MTSSGDLLADRRYAYAEASLKEGDLPAAIDLARQAIEIAPRYAPAWFLIGEARAEQYRGAGSTEEGVVALAAAREAFEMALMRDPEDGQGARLRLAALGIGDPLDAMSPDYVRQLFDDYAVRFDRHLTASLKYRAPAVLREAVRRSVGLRREGLRFSRALDLGCGTGLAAEAFDDLCGHLAGVDLSPAMVERARRKKLYDELASDELVTWLATRVARSADLVLAADVFVYVADLAPVFSEISRVLAPEGLFAFTVQSHEGRDVQLGEDLRYAHAEAHVAELASAVGMRVVLSEEASTREDRGVPVPGRVLVLALAERR